MIIVLMIIICILLILLIRKPKNIIIHNKSDILKGIELEKRKEAIQSICVALMVCTFFVCVTLAIIYG